MPKVVGPRRPQSGDLDRAISAVRMLETSGLGRLDWIGPNWIDVMADMDWKSLDFLSHWIAQNTRLRRRLRGCKTPGELQCVQMNAICDGLAEYGRTSGRASGVNLDFLSACAPYSHRTKVAGQ